jgi:hypothetical protein
VIAEVVSEARWEHSECGASGEALFDDEISPDAGHEGRGKPGVVGWYGQCECLCGAGGDGEWEDGDPAASSHECDNGGEFAEQGDDEVEEVAA